MLYIVTVYTCTMFSIYLTRFSNAGLPLTQVNAFIAKPL